MTDLPESAPDQRPTSAPTLVRAEPRNAAALVQWNPPANQTISGYQISWEGSRHRVEGFATAAIVEGLTNGHAYTFTVAASNHLGQGPPSEPSNTVVPATTPEAPPLVVATRGNAGATVSWTAPADTGGIEILEYEVSWSFGLERVRVPGSEARATIDGLVNGQAYSFKVAAANARGQGAASLPSNWVTPSTVPDRPTAVVAEAGAASATVSWTAGWDGGSALDRFVVLTEPPLRGPVSVPARSRSMLVEGLANGTPHRFRVVSVNDIGESEPSVPSAYVVPASVPGAPEGVVVEARSGSALLTWDPPSTDGGRELVSFEIAVSPLGFLRTVPADTRLLSLNALINGTTYVASVSATNAIGKGPASPAVSFQPSSVPSAPLQLTTVPGPGHVTLSWEPPIDDGGLALTAYIVLDEMGEVLARTPEGVTSTQLDGLGPGEGYDLHVVAENSRGRGPASETRRARAFGPPSPFESSLKVTPASVPADGVSAIAVRVVARDSEGALLPDQDVVFSSSDPADVFEAPSSRTGADGVVEARLRSTRAGWRTIVAEVGEARLEGRARFLLLPCQGMPEFAGRRPTRALGSDVTHVLASDLDGDGLLDLVVSRRGGSLSTYLGRGGGAFGDERPFSVGTVEGDPAITLADLNRDGATDLVVVTRAEVIVLQGNGNGDFSERLRIAAALARRAVAADFNGDGWLDLAMARQILMNDGAGGFVPIAAPALRVDEGDGALLAVSDLDRNGRPDLVSIGSSDLRWYIVEASGAMTVSAVLHLSFQPDSIAIGDVDGDGNDEVLVNSRGGLLTAHLVAPLAGQLLTYVETSPWPITNAFILGTNEIGFFDADADGDLDLVRLDGNAGIVQVLLNDGRGNFEQPHLYAAGHGPTAFVTADLNDDLLLDLLFVSDGASYVHPPARLDVLFNAGRGEFAPGEVVLSRSRVVSLAAGQFDSDGLTDLMIREWYAGTTARIAWGQETGFAAPVVAFSFASLVPPSLILSTTRSWPIDANGDQLDDLYFIVGSSSFSPPDATFVITPNGDRTFAAAAAWPALREPLTLKADFNDDGLQDVLSPAGSAVTFVPGLPRGRFGPTVSIPTSGVVVAMDDYDVDSDGDLDVMVGTEKGTLDYLVNDGHGGFSRRATYTVEPDLTALIVEDVDRDGRPDLIVGGRTMGTRVLPMTGCR